jgi:4-hydroxybenzoate polyprenyltransferase
MGDGAMTTGVSGWQVRRSAHRRVIPLFRACHLQPTLAVTAITATLAASAGRGAGTLAVAVAVLAGQLSVGWSNDFVDRGRDARAGRVDKPIVAGEVTARAVAIAAAIAFAAVVPLSLLSGWRAAAVHVAAVGVAWLYNIWLKATAVSVIAFAVAFGALPAFVTFGLPGHPAPPLWAVGSAAALGAGAHLINALPDLEEDQQVGVRGLPHRLGALPSVACGTALIAVATLVLLFAPAGRPGGVAIALAVPALLAVIAVAVLVARDRLRSAWTFVLVAAGAAALVLVAQGNQLQ